MLSFETLHSHQPQPTLSLSWKTGLCLLGPFGMLGTSSSLKDTKIIHLTFSIHRVLSSRNTNKSHCAADSSHHSRVTLSILMIFRYGLILIQLLCFLHYCLLELRAHDLHISYSHLQVSVKLSTELFKKKKKEKKRTLDVRVILTKMTNVLYLFSLVQILLPYGEVAYGRKYMRSSHLQVWELRVHVQVLLSSKCA